MSQEPTPAYANLRTFWKAKSDNTEGDGGSKVTSTTTKGTNNAKFIMADLAPSALEFDQEIVGVHLAKFLNAAQQIGGEVAEHANLVQKAFKAQKDFLDVATRSAKPDDGTIAFMVADTSKWIAEIQSYREKRRSSPVFNHLSGVSESILALGWVMVAPTPAPHVKEMNDAGQFYTNRVLKDFRDTPGHSEWAKAWVDLIVALQTYVRKNHTTGLVWGKAPLAVRSGGAPPPPPPPTYDLDDIQHMNVSGSGSDDRAALFAVLNQGEDVAKGLRKVTADMQTHKNPNLRVGSTVAASDTRVSNDTPKGPVQAKPPKFALEGKKWSIEYQVGQKNLTIDKVEMNQVVYMFGCKDSVINVKGKLNSIVIDSCVKTAIVFESLVSSIEFVNSKDCQMQVMGKVPTITIDKVDGLQMYLSQDSVAVEIFTSKSSALNVMLPKGNSGEYSEHPIPEQFKTVVAGGKGLVTTPSETVGV